MGSLSTRRGRHALVHGAAMVGAFFALSAQALAAAPVPFNPATPTIFVAQSPAGGNTQLKMATEANGAITFHNVGPVAGIQYNAISYDQTDNFIYGIALTGGAADHVIRIGQNGVIADTGIDTGIGAFVGVFGPNGNLYISDGTTTKQINITTHAVSNFVLHPAGVGVEADWALSGGFFWGLGLHTLQRVDPTTGNVTNFTIPATLTPGQTGGAGAAWTYGNGNLGFSENDNGNVYQISVTNPAAATPTFKLVAHQAGPSSSGNDGTAGVGEPTDLAVTKTAAPTSAGPGATIHYTLTVTNNGPGNSSGYVLNDTVPAGFTSVSVSPGSPTCTVTGVSIQCNGAPLNNGSSATYTVTAHTPATFTAPLTNTATVTANETDPVSSNDSDQATVSPDLPAVSIKKHAFVTPVADQSAAQVGDVISYQYDVTNTGNDTLASVSVNDPSIGAVSCNNLGLNGLAPNATTTCTAQNTHVVTQADVDAGKVTDSATAKGTDTDGNVSPTSSPDTATVDTVSPQPSLSIVKTPSASLGDTTPVKVGETITYTYVVTNTGNVDMKSITVSDTTAGPVICDAIPAAGLAPQQSVNCHAQNTYTVTQADVDSNGVSDTATASGVDPSGTNDTSGPDSKRVPSAPGPAVSITKTPHVTPVADQNGVKVGDTIAYSYRVTNIGNVTLSSISVTDSDATIGQINCDPLPAGGLLPGGVIACSSSGSHTVTQADVDAGEVTDTATATGVDRQGNASPKSNPATATVPAVSPVLADQIVKSAQVTPAADQNAVQAGDTIAYSYDVTNTGNITLKKVDVTDPTGGSVTCDPLPAGGLPPTGTVHCTADNAYTVTQADVDSGQVVDEATATGTGVDGIETPPSPPSKKTVPAASPNPAVSVTKTPTVTPAGDEQAVKVGDLISYAYDVKNTGNVTLASIDVSDPSIGQVDCPAPAPPGLAPGATERCGAVATYVVTQADVDAGSVKDTATATGTDTNGNTSGPATGTATENAVTPSPSISLTKIPNGSGGNTNQVHQNDTITYSYLVKNTGNVTLTGIAVTDATFPELNPVTCVATTLAPDETTNCTGANLHTVTAGEAGTTLTDTSQVTSTDPAGGAVTDSDQASVPSVADPAISVTKTAAVSPAADQNAIQLGDAISYSYEVTNTGDVTLTNVGVSDPTAGSTTCTQTTLDPGEHTSCTADGAFVVTQADVDAGKVPDTATASGQFGGATVNASDSKTVYSSPSPRVSIVKKATVSPSADQTAVKVGDTIAYTYTVRNIGNVTLASVDVNDPTAGTVTCTFPHGATLAPGDAASCHDTADHTVTQADVDAGKVTDYATATGTDTLGTTSPTASDTATVDAVPPAPDVSVAKHGAVSPASDASKIKVGDTIVYSYLVTNTGNVTLKTLSVTDPTIGPVTCPTPAPPGLAPGASVSCTGTTSHTVTQTDVDAGGVSDRADAFGIDTSGNRSPDRHGTDTSPSVRSPSVSVVKTATVDPAADQNAAKIGDMIVYSFEVTNTGNVDLTAAHVTDTALGPVECPIPAPPGLPPGQSETCHGALDHVVTPADVKAGKVTNTATGTGTGPDGHEGPPSAPSTATVRTAPAESALTIRKSVNHTSAVPGQPLIYTLTVTNKGPDPSPNTVVTDTPSITMKVRSIHPSTGTCRRRATIRCSLGTLAVGAKVTIIIKATVLESGTEHNVAKVTGGNRNPNPKNAVAAATTKVRATFVVHTKASTHKARPGQNITYHITVSNPDAVATRNVTVCDTMPFGLVFVKASPNPHRRNGLFCWTVHSLGAHKTVRFTIVASPAPGRGDPKTTQVTVTAPGARPAHASTTVDIAPAAPIPCGSASQASASQASATGKRPPTARTAC